MMKELNNLIEQQRISEKEKLGTIATTIWIIFIIVQLLQDKLDFLTLKTLLMFLPGIFVGAIAMTIPYLILFRGFVILATKFHFSDTPVILFRYIKRIIEIIFAWYTAQLFFQILNYFF